MDKAACMWGTFSIQTIKPAGPQVLIAACLVVLRMVEKFTCIKFSFACKDTVVCII